MIGTPAAELDPVQLDQRIKDVVTTFSSGNFQRAAPFSAWSSARTAKSPVAPPPSGTDMVTNYLHQCNGGKMGAGRHRPFPFYGQVRSPQSWFSITMASQTPRKSKDAPLSKATPPDNLDTPIQKESDAWKTLVDFFLSTTTQRGNMQHAAGKRCPDAQMCP